MVTGNGSASRWIAIGAVALVLATTGCTTQTAPTRSAEAATASAAAPGPDAPAAGETAPAVPGPDAPAAGATAPEDVSKITVPVKNVRVCVFNDLVGSQTGDIKVTFYSGDTSGIIPVAGQRCGDDQGFSTILPNAGSYPEVSMRITMPDGSGFYGVATNEPFLYPWAGFYLSTQWEMAADAYFYENETVNMVVNGNRVRVTRLDDSWDAKNFEFHIVNK